MSLPTADEGARAILEAFSQAWAHDADAIAACFGDRAELVDVLGRTHLGRDAIASVFRHNFATIHRESTTRYACEDVTELAEDVAFVRASSTLDVPAGPLAGRSNATLTMVLVPDGDAWTILRFHATFVRELPAA